MLTMKQLKDVVQDHAPEEEELPPELMTLSLPHPELDRGVIRIHKILKRHFDKAFAQQAFLLWNPLSVDAPALTQAVIAIEQRLHKHAQPETLKQDIQAILEPLLLSNPTYNRSKIQEHEQRRIAAEAQSLVDRQARAAAEAAAAKAEAAAAKAEAEVARLKAALAEQKEIAGQEQRVAEKQAPKAGFFIVPKRPVPEPVNAEALEDNEDHLNKKTRKSPC
ncbi:MAG: hypothetical protein ACOVQX_02075 [Legionella sp.]